ncbi:uncharacterized protein LOC125687575 isoform X2 [Lagopus muta]|uniref:uncharacterized protein LOC125687575 isoform X2 n=1 Tax=Lagopus muta TaxID=64668 RepID=UPI00209DCC9F|nr:uncharacterized protein LOC125687575 isoform X2 [Lagopus muta]
MGGTGRAELSLAGSRLREYCSDRAVMAVGIVMSPATWRGGAALFGKFSRQEFSANVIREEEPLWTRSALRSVMFQRKLLCFFLAARDKAVVRLSEAEDSGTSVSTVEAFCTPNGACKCCRKAVI